MKAVWTTHTHTQRHADAHMQKYRVKDSETLHNVSVRLITGQMAVSGLSEDVGRMSLYICKLISNCVRMDTHAAN